MASRTHSPHVVVLGLLALSGIAHAEEPLVREAAANIHVLLGGEPHGARGTPVAFGVGAELLWRARVGGFAALLSSSGTPVVPMKEGDVTLPSLADRISVPFGLAARPFTPLVEGDAWWQRLVQGIGLQVGLTVEHYRTSLSDDTTAGLHAALSLDIPLYGGPRTGGVALRGYARMLVTPEFLLERESTQMVYVGYVSSQIYMGLCWTP